MQISESIDTDDKRLFDTQILDKNALKVARAEAIPTTPLMSDVN